MSKRTRFLRTMEVLGFMLFFTGFVAQAQTTSKSGTSTKSAQKNDHQRHHDIIIGICAGQKLATLETPIILPVPVRGQTPIQLDDQTKEALKKALDECYQEMMGSNQGSSVDATSSNLSRKN